MLEPSTIRPAKSARCSAEQERSRAAVVVPDVVGDVAEVRPEADHRRLVRHGDDTVQQRFDARRIGDVREDVLGPVVEIPGRRA